MGPYLLLLILCSTGLLGLALNGTTLVHAFWPCCGATGWRWGAFDGRFKNASCGSCCGSATNSTIISRPFNGGRSRRIDQLVVTIPVGVLFFAAVTLFDDAAGCDVVGRNGFLASSNAFTVGTLCFLFGGWLELEFGFYFYIEVLVVFLKVDFLYYNIWRFKDCFKLGI